jgi:2-keto-4-pentenoate hydratase/2-oxohepta-3-ene-1,7-dioic acid hydratase in catechol pathway
MRLISFRVSGTKALAVLNSRGVATGWTAADDAYPGSLDSLVREGQAMIDNMAFDVATQISLVSEAITLNPGDIFVTGTPAGVGLSQKPPLWMKPGDVCDVEIDQIGILRNPIIDDRELAATQ